MVHVQILGQSRKDLAAKVVDEVRALQQGASDEEECAEAARGPAPSFLRECYDGIGVDQGRCIRTRKDGDGIDEQSLLRVDKAKESGKTHGSSVGVEERTVLQIRAQVTGGWALRVGRDRALLKAENAICCLAPSLIAHVNFQRSANSLLSSSACVTLSVYRLYRGKFSIRLIALEGAWEEIA